MCLSLRHTFITMIIDDESCHGEWYGSIMVMGIEEMVWKATMMRPTSPSHFLSCHHFYNWKCCFYELTKSRYHAPHITDPYRGWGYLPCGCPAAQTPPTYLLNLLWGPNFLKTPHDKMRLTAAYRVEPFFRVAFGLRKLVYFLLLKKYLLGFA